MTVHFQDDSIAIHVIQCGPYGNNAYLVICPETNESIVIDAPQTRARSSRRRSRPMSR